jgi:hypothetical protein
MIVESHGEVKLINCSCRYMADGDESYVPSCARVGSAKVSKHRSWCISGPEFWRLALAAVAIGYGAVVVMLWLAHIGSSL